MPKLNQKDLRKLALDIVAKNPGGIRWAELLRQIMQQHPETPAGTVVGACRNLNEQFPNLVVRPERGLYKPSQPSDGSTITDAEEQPASETKVKILEKEFYEPFANWLQDDLGEVTLAVPLGGSSFAGKWSTPDVVGVFRPRAADIVKFTPEIISVEIKVDPKTPVVAFGQAISYRLFSTKTYVAMPNSISDEDATRLESLCLLFGVGLVLFDLNPTSPNFSIRVRAQRFVPDMFYVNTFADQLKDNHRDLFQELFG